MNKRILRGISLICTAISLIQIITGLILHAIANRIITICSRRRRRRAAFYAA